MSTKETNPKDAAASTRVNVSLVPDSLKVMAALAFTEGALKYGAFNWRVAPVKSMVYLNALERHLMRYRNGEEVDPATGVPHLASILACAGIIIDAGVCHTLVDDRPPRGPMTDLLKFGERTTEELQRLFADDYAPTQWTQAELDLR